ncbi:hypothetical protein [Nocardiopsis synnemataformans]|uniref:hypothetical protein n=1 Tax=Nocardiopsis synnemataformans TaxID=61305 RepID=UPI003EBCADB2
MGDLLQGLTSIPSESLRLITMLAGMVALNGLIGMASFFNERILLAARKIKESVNQSPEKILQQELEHTRFKVEDDVKTIQQPIETHKERVLSEAKKIKLASELVPRAKNFAEEFEGIKEILDDLLKSKRKEDKQKERNSALAKKMNQSNSPAQKKNSRRTRR